MGFRRSLVRIQSPRRSRRGRSSMRVSVPFAPSGAAMIAIRLAKGDWGKAWRAMIEIGPVRLVADDPIYEVLPAYLEHLAARGFAYEVVMPQAGRKEKRRQGTAH